MSFRDPSPAARANWDALDDHQARQAIMWAAGHLAQHQGKYFQMLGKDVVGVGHGYREKRLLRKGKPPAVQFDDDELVIKVFVKKKWSSEEDSASEESDRVPGCIQLRVPVPAPLPERPSKTLVRGLWDPTIKVKKAKGWPKWLQVALPTDVALLRTAKPDGNLPPLRVVAAAPNENDIEGTACTLVKVRGTGGTRPYLLGCMHVLMRALVTQNAVPDRERLPSMTSGSRSGPSSARGSSTIRVRTVSTRPSSS